jgi:hypothetical protein
MAGRAAWLAAFPVLCEAQIKLLAPDSLVREYLPSGGNIFASTATFGAPYYGERVLGQILWASSDKGLSHCSKDDYTHDPDLPVDHSGISDAAEAPLKRIVLVRRGSCTFTTKVRIAEMYKNADAVIIIDEQTSPASLGEMDIREMVLGDDGFGDSVSIPSMMVTYQDGEALRLEAEKGNQVIIELNWDMPQASRVLVDFWSSSASIEGQEFLKDFYHSATRLSGFLSFVPHYYVFRLPEMSDWCSGSSEFCAEDPDGPSGPITGRDVVEEDKRQLCIWHLTAGDTRSAHDNTELKMYSASWFFYVKEFAESCPLDGKTEETRFGEKCSKKILDLENTLNPILHLGITTEHVDECVRNKGEEYLRDEKHKRAWSPLALRINGWRYSGSLDYVTVEKAICTGYAEMPQDCKEIMEGKQTIIHNGPSFGQIFSAVSAFLVFAAFLVCGFWLYQRYLSRSVRSALREEVQLEVISQVGRYNKLADGE